MKSVKLNKSLVLDYYRKWDSAVLPQFVRADKVTGERGFYWSEEDLTDAMNYYGSRFFDYFKIRWV